MSEGKSIPLVFHRRPEAEMVERASWLRSEMQTRRSVREFSPEPVPDEVIRDCVLTAAQAPSGANKQPWTFVVVTDPGLKKAIREAAEKEEKAFYGGRAPQTWLDDLAPIGTGWQKPFLETAPALVVVFAQKTSDDGGQHYYVQESVGLASGFLIAALHHAGLCTLTHTPSPMRFLAEILGRPDHEKAFLLLPVGYPAEGATVPDITRKPPDEVLVHNLGATHAKDDLGHMTDPDPG